MSDREHTASVEKSRTRVRSPRALFNLIEDFLHPLHDCPTGESIMIIIDFHIELAHLYVDAYWDCLALWIPGLNLSNLDIKLIIIHQLILRITERFDYDLLGG